MNKFVLLLILGLPALYNSLNNLPDKEWAPKKNVRFLPYHDFSGFLPL